MSSSTIQDRAAESQDLISNHILPLLRGVKQGRSPTEWTFYCPLAHRKKNAAAAIWVDKDGWIRVHCFDCQRNSELRNAVVTPALKSRSQGPIRSDLPRTPPPQRERPRFNPAPGIWGNTEPITAGRHPGRLWFNHRNLWRPDVTCPAGLRWLPRDRTYPGPHSGAGSIVALLAPPQAWALAWPQNPAVTAVEIIAIDQDGRPALDRPTEKGGLGKRTLGDKSGAVLVIGNPLLETADHPVRVSEGVADALALASRFSGPTVATMGDAGMKTGELASWLARAGAGIVIHADNDRPGQEAAHRLRLAVLALGGQARAVLPAKGKDAADTAAALQGFQAPTAVWPLFAESLQEMYGWPPWEAERQAAILMENVEDI